MPNEKFVSELKDLGHEVEVLSENRIAILYTPFDGRLKGKVIKVGFEVPPDLEVTPPTGPHITPALLTINEGALTHPERVAPSAFGTEWQYLSRPFQNEKGGWANSSRSTKEYMRFIDDILNTL